MDDIIDTLEAVGLGLVGGILESPSGNSHGNVLAAKGNRKYCPAIYVMNKIDQITIEELDIIAEAL